MAGKIPPLTGGRDYNCKLYSYNDRTGIWQDQLPVRMSLVAHALTQAYVLGELCERE